MKERVRKRERPRMREILCEKERLENLCVFNGFLQEKDNDGDLNHNYRMLCDRPQHTYTDVL